MIMIAYHVTKPRIKLHMYLMITLAFTLLSCVRYMRFLSYTGFSGPKNLTVSKKSKDNKDAKNENALLENI